MLVIVFLLISQIVLALSQCSCGDNSDYYNAYSYPQPTYQQYNPYQYGGYSYDYSSYAQPAYDNPGVIAYPYPVPVTVIYEKEVETCPCKSSCGYQDSEYEPRRKINPDDYCSSRCTCTSTEYKHRDTCPRYRSDSSDRWVNRECPCKKTKAICPRYESDEGITRKCVCYCEDIRDTDYRVPMWEDREYRQESSCGCGCKSKY